jgi:hypothetical protein
MHYLDAHYANLVSAENACLGSGKLGAPQLWDTTVSDQRFVVESGRIVRVRLEVCRRRRVTRRRPKVGNPSGSRPKMASISAAVVPLTPSRNCAYDEHSMASDSGIDCTVGSVGTSRMWSCPSTASRSSSMDVTGTVAPRMDRVTSVALMPIAGEESWKSTTHATSRPTIPSPPQVGACCESGNARSRSIRPRQHERSQILLTPNRGPDFARSGTSQLADNLCTRQLQPRSGTRRVHVGPPCGGERHHRYRLSGPNRVVRRSTD